MRNLIELLCETPWAIAEERLKAMGSAIFMKGQDLGIDASVLAGVPAESSGIKMLNDGIAVIPVSGVLQKKDSFWMRLFGGTSYEGIRNNVLSAVNDESVKSIVLHIDTPGGSVDGVMEAVDAIYSARGKKPIIALADGQATSAGYWIASAADKVIVGESSFVGSIGVITAHVDYSKMDERIGVKVTIIKAGKYKAAGSDNAPLSKEDKDYIQSHIDYLYTLFVNGVARNRNMKAEQIINTEARVFIGQQAIDAGLADEIGTLDSVVAGAKAEAVSTKINANVIIQEEMNMDLNELKTKYPEVYKAVCDEIRAQVTAELGQQHKDALAVVEGTYTAKVSSMEAQMQGMQVQLSAAQKDIAISKEAAIKADAEKIWTEKLLASSIPEHLHDKVRSQVRYGTFVKDGSFDAKAFSDAVDAEVKDWEARMDSASQQTVLGGGYLKPDAAKAEEKDDDEWVNGMIGKVNQAAAK